MNSHCWIWNLELTFYCLKMYCLLTTTNYSVLFYLYFNQFLKYLLRHLKPNYLSVAQRWATMSFYVPGFSSAAHTVYKEYCCFCLTEWKHVKLSERLFLFGFGEWSPKLSLQACSVSSRGQLLNWRGQSALF